MYTFFKLGLLVEYGEYEDVAMSSEDSEDGRAGPVPNVAENTKTRQKQIDPSVTRVRQDFPETWLWSEENTE